MTTERQSEPQETSACRGRSWKRETTERPFVMAVRSNPQAPCACRGRSWKQETRRCDHLPWCGLILRNRALAADGPGTGGHLPCALSENVRLSRTVLETRDNGTAICDGCAVESSGAVRLSRTVLEAADETVQPFGMVRSNPQEPRACRGRSWNRRAFGMRALRKLLVQNQTSSGRLGYLYPAPVMRSRSDLQAVDHQTILNIDH